MILSPSSILTLQIAPPGFSMTHETGRQSNAGEGVEVGLWEGFVPVDVDEGTDKDALDGMNRRTSCSAG